MLSNINSRPKKQMAVSTSSVKSIGIQIHQVLVSGSFGSEDSGLITFICNCNTSGGARQSGKCGNRGSCPAF
jgi:hypothetical protein